MKRGVRPNMELSTIINKLEFCTQYSLRVYYEDTDAGGVVYYANYLKFVERARTEFLREIGIPHENIKKKWNVEFVVKSSLIDYIKPAFLDDLLEVRTCCVEVRGASSTLRQAVLKNDIVIVDTTIKIACISMEHARAVKMPSDIKAAFDRMKIT